MASASKPTGTIRQTIRFHATPRSLYAAFTESRRHAAFTRSPARIQARVGGKFSAYDGYAEGRMLVLGPAKEIALSWRASDWPEGVESTIRITLKPAGKGTVLTFVQEGVPRDQVADIREGWREFYWEPLRKYLEEPEAARQRR